VKVLVKTGIYYLPFARSWAIGHLNWLPPKWNSTSCISSDTIVQRRLNVAAPRSCSEPHCHMAEVLNYFFFSNFQPFFFM
jgi:hypothetical protein